MSTSYTTKAGLAKPANGDSSWGTTINSTIDALDGFNSVGGGAVQLAEVPSASLNVKVAACVFRKSDGTLVSYAGVSSQAMTTAATNYLYLNDSGTLVVNTTGFPASTFHVRLATVVAGASTVTSVTDSRVPLVSGGNNGNTIYLALVGGTFDDSGGVITVGLGTTNGVKIGGSASQKLGFYGATPVVQPSGANQAAITDSTGGTAGFTLSAVGATNSGDVSGTINNNFASLARLVGQIRSALVSEGLIKGSA